MSRPRTGGSGGRRPGAWACYLPIAEHGLIGDRHGRAARQLSQAFTHLALVSAACNLDRRLG